MDLNIDLSPFVFVVLDSEQILSPELLFTIKNLNIEIPKITYYSNLSDHKLELFINDLHSSSFISDKDTFDEIKKKILVTIENASEIDKKNQLKKEALRKNKELESFTTSLENVVEERTLFIQKAASEEAEKLNKERALIKFIQEISEIRSIEDVLLYFRKDIRRFPKVSDPIFIYRQPNDQILFYFFNAANLQKNISSIDFEFPQEIYLNNKKISQSLADHFKRPFIKTLSFPLDLKLIRESSKGEYPALICLENSFNEKETRQFLDYLHDRIGLLSIKLDQLFIENQISNFAYRWEQTFDGIKDPIVILDQDYNIIRSNKKFTTSLALKKCYQEFAGSNQICSGCPVKESFKENKPVAKYVHLHDRVYQVYSYPIFLTGTIGASNIVNQYVDITEQRQLYLKMLQSEKMEALGLLAGNIAHELNNPLTGIRSLAQILRTENSDNKRLAEDLIEIEKASERSQRIIKNLLNFSRGSAELLEVTTLDQIIQDTLPFLKTIMRPHRQNIDLNASEFKIKVEAGLIQQVIFNLINNACQAMKNPGLLEIKTKIIQNENKKYAEFVLTDTGGGIPKNVQEKIFQPFFTTKAEGHGTGLGLNITKSIIERFNGKIYFQSVEGLGTAFTFLLPVEEK